MRVGLLICQSYWEQQETVQEKSLINLVSSSDHNAV